MWMCRNISIMATPDERIFISGTRETQSRTNLFRPKELREVVFPGMGMIMHSLFWVKHTFALAEHGYPLTDQDAILLWATGEEPDYTESLLYYCVYSNMGTAGEMTVNAGQRATRDWLFRKNPDQPGGIYAQLARNLQRLAEQQLEPDYEAFVEASFAPWFRTRCDELGVDLVAELEDTVGSALDESEPGHQEQALASRFATAVGQVVRSHSSLRSSKDTLVISTTFNFARRVYDTATPEQRSTLGNTRLQFTADEATALLEAVRRIDHGEHFLRSLMFMLYLDPAAHRRDEITQQMRHLYDTVTEDPEEIVTTVQTEYLLSVFDDRVVEGLNATAFYWVLNFFMADGETIARDLLDEIDSPIDVGDVRDYFDSNSSTADRYRSFFRYTDECQTHLSTLLTELRETDAGTTVTFVETLMSGLDEGLDPAALFLELLASQGTVTEKSEGQYLISTRPQNTNAASFYGIGPLISWAETLATSIR